MTNFIFGLILFICLVPTLLILYFLMYPREWRNKNRIFGINNREEFKEEKSAEFIDGIVATHRKQATVILSVLLVFSVVMLLIPSLDVKMITGTVLVYISLFAIAIPFAMGNSELKKYKNCLGIVSEKVLYADLKAAGRIHALNVPLLIVANIVGLLIVVLSLLADFGILPFQPDVYRGGFICTLSVSSVIFTNLILLPIAFMLDSARNQVISEDSDVNANYNRGMKKLLSDLMLGTTWINDITALVLLGSALLFHSEVSMVVILAVYLLALMAVMAVYASKKSALDRKYFEKENLAQDDDDAWIFGMFYYNPQDKNLNVPKRVGIGGTINMAHPAGKAITAIGVLCLVASLIMLIFLGMMSGTPIRVTDNGNELICHHLWDEYKIEKSEILSLETGNTGDLHFVKLAGTGMENVLKGKYAVNGDSGCTLFLNPRAEEYIKIVTKDKTYYISGNTKEETLKLYEELSPVL